ncbi:MAG: hypothetical protein IKR68_04000 [Lachnospiraceae bacterium]|nr:hypothetical protein [Lachnospiraceae bacterium]
MGKIASVLGKIILAILVICGILFVLIMLWPDPEDEEGSGEKAEAVYETETLGKDADETAAVGDKTGKTEENDEEKDEEKNEEKNEEEKKVGDESIEPASVEDGAKSATVMIYMNGSDLESEMGEASLDISEMMDSGIGSNVNVIIQTMGTLEWQDHGIASDTSQIYRVKKGELQLLEEDLGQLDCTRQKTLSDFIKYGKKNYPADRYILLFWDHGGGPVYGFGYDQWQEAEDSLTLDEISGALSENNDISFDLIGMDCCIMGNLETCYVLSPFCRYALLSEDFESGLGWDYADWMKTFEQNPGITTPLLGKKIIDGMVKANDEDTVNGSSATMILVNERKVPDLFEKWKAYAYENQDTLLGINYSKLHGARGKGIIDDILGIWGEDGSNVTMADYYVSDILSIVESVGKESEKTKALRDALKTGVSYFGHTSDTNELTGISISLPYGDPEFYKQLAGVYGKCGFDDRYVKWLGKFVDATGMDSYNDYSDFEDSWGGWGSYSQGWSGYEDEDEMDDWEYDFDEELWYLYEDGVLYLYDDESDTMFYYDEEYDELYYYDDDDDDWYLYEEE